jgi:2-oxo-3-hexenedioate decarboxylase
MDAAAAATELLGALDANETLSTFTGRDPGFTTQAAYEVAAEVLRRRRARGEKPIGRKIGFTNRTIWPEYGVSVPIWAHVYDTTVTFLDEPAGRVAVGHLCQPRLEPEIVLHFARAPGGARDAASLLAHVDWIAHGFEIVQCHYPEWKFRAADTVADFGLHGALAVGPRHPVAGLPDLVRSLRELEIALAGEAGELGRGRGANVLDSPLLAAVHLLRVLEEQPLFAPVQAGEIVTTGTLVSPPKVRPGESYHTELSGLPLEGLRLQLA